MLSQIIEEFFEIPDNPLAKIFLIIIVILITTLIIAVKNKKLELFLRKKNILDQDETPLGFLSWIIGVIIIIRIIQIFLVQPFLVDGSSMYPTLQTGNLLIIDKLTYKLKEPERGDVIVFKFKKENSELNNKYFIKRLIGLPGDQLILKDGKLQIITKENQKIISEEEYIKIKNFNENINITLNDNEYFVIGDNRLGSYDSRSWGAIKKEQISGRAIIQIYPFDVFPGKISYTK